jgi:SNF2 family DNA or RNA helicase
MNDLILPPLWSHQQKALEVAGRYFALFFDTGTGKTRTALELYKRNKTVNGKIIIVTPLNVCKNWEYEIAEYVLGKRKIYQGSGSNKAKKLKAIIEFCAESLDCHQFLIVNTETFRTAEYRKWIAKSGATFVIIDEAHNFKTSSSLQTKGLLEVVSYLRPLNLYLLTGTPAPQGEIDLWTTFYLMRQTNLNFYLWRKKYFEDVNQRRAGTKGYYPNFVVRKESQVEFQKLLSECSLTANKNEVLDLPPVLKTNVYAEMSEEQAKHYTTMREYLFAADDNGNEVTATNILSRALRLQQILAGIIGKGEVIDNPRLKALDYAIEMTGNEQFIIWTIFAPTYKQIGKVLEAKGITYGLLTGEQDQKIRDQNMADFQAGKLRCLVAHPRAGGVGVNLTAASYSIHYTKSFNLVDDMQCEARNYRGGSEIHDRITRIDIITQGTIDEDITYALRAKKTAQDFILGLNGK